MPPSKANILLVEDEQKLARFIERYLVSNGFDVEVNHDGSEVVEMAGRKEFALIILDLNLPKRSGFEILYDLRSGAVNTPVLILSARERVADRVRALEMGADDYLTKPFDSSELSARIQAILRRVGNLVPTTLQAADLVMDLLRQTVSRGGREISLSRREYALLEFFLRNKNQVLTRKRIAEQVWGYTFDTGTNIVDVYVSYLRKAVDDGFEKPLLHTVVRMGYVLRDEGP